VNRFQNALTPATLIAGFCFTGIVELDFTDQHELSNGSRIAEPVFYMTAVIALSLALYVTAVSSMGIVFGQRLTIQATAIQGSDHDNTVKEMNTKFFYVLLALGVSMACVVVAATSVIWLKDPTSVTSGKLWHNYWLSIAATTVVAVLFLLTVLSMMQMFTRLFTPTPVMGSLSLKTTKGRSLSQVPEFYVGSDPPPPTESGRRRLDAGFDAGTQLPPDERSGLLKAFAQK